MIQMFQTCGIDELCEKPSLGQPPALWYSETAQITTSITIRAPPMTARVRKCRFRSISLIASSRTVVSAAAAAVATGGFLSSVCCVDMTDLFPFVSGVAEGVARLEADGAPDRDEGDEECEQDRPGEGEQDVPGRVGEWHFDVDDRLGHPDEEQVEQYADWDADQPAEGCEDDGLGGEDAADVAGAGADRAEDADLAGAFEHAHRQRVREAGHADRDDQESEYDHRGDERLVVRDLVSEHHVDDLRGDVVAVGVERVLDTRRRPVNE